MSQPHVANSNPESPPAPAEQSIGIRRLRADLATYVKRAAAGESIVVTVDGRPLARLGSLEGGVPARSLDALAHLNLVTPPRRLRDEKGVGAGRSRSPQPAAVGDVRVDRLVRQVRG